MVLNTDARSLGGIQHLPPITTLRAHRGFIISHGQLMKGSKCGDEGQLPMNCLHTACFTFQCKGAQKCNLCREEGHVFRVCLKSFVKKVQTPQQEKEEEREKEWGWWKRPHKRDR